MTIEIVGTNVIVDGEITHCATEDEAISFVVALIGVGED